MPCSPEKIAANRRNSLKSTGPSASGKLISRRNSLKHGLTGAGIVIPDEDVEAVQERIDAFQADLKPRNDVAGFLATRAAVLSVRLDRCVRREASQITQDMMRAEGEEAEDRADELAYYVALFDKEPTKAVRNLKRSPEGIDWLILAWRQMLANLFQAKYPAFSSERARNLSGGPATSAVSARLTTLEMAFAGHFGPPKEKEGDRAGLTDAELREAARVELKRHIEGEIARLEGIRAGLDHAAIAKDRAGAKSRAIFDPSKEAALARKYEAAAERMLHKTLEQIERINAQADEEGDASASDESTKDCDELASSLPDEEGEGPKPLARRSRGPLASPSRPGNELRRPEEGPETTEEGDIGEKRRTLVGM